MCAREDELARADAVTDAMMKHWRKLQQAGVDEMLLHRVNVNQHLDKGGLDQNWWKHSSGCHNALLMSVMLKVLHFSGLQISFDLWYVSKDLDWWLFSEAINHRRGFQDKPTAFCDRSPRGACLCVANGSVDFFCSQTVSFRALNDISQTKVQSTEKINVILHRSSLSFLISSPDDHLILRPLLMRVQVGNRWFIVSDWSKCLLIIFFHFNQLLLSALMETGK